MKYLLRIFDFEDNSIDEEVFDNEDDLLGRVCSGHFEIPKEDKRMVDIVQSIKMKGVWDDDFLRITVTEVDDKFYLREDGAKCFARAEVIVPTGLNKVTLSLEVVEHFDEHYWKNIEICCGDRINGSAKSMITIGGIDEERGAAGVLRDFAKQIMKIADKMEAE